MEIEPVHLERFLKSRKTEKTRKNSRLLLEYLINQRDKNHQEYIRSRDLKDSLVSPEKIPNNSSFYEFLHDLEKYGLIERDERKLVKRQKGKTPVFYRVNPSISQSTFDLIDLSKEELIGVLGKQISIDGTIDFSSNSSLKGHMTTKRERELEVKLKTAKQKLREYGLTNPDEEIKKKLEKTTQRERELEVELRIAIEILREYELTDQNEEIEKRKQN